MIETQTRTLLVHLNVEVPVSDERTADEVADAILLAIRQAPAIFNTRDLHAECPLAEEA